MPAISTRGQALWGRSDLTDRYKNRFASLKYHPKGGGRKQATLDGVDVCTKPSPPLVSSLFISISLSLSFAFILSSSRGNFLYSPLFNTNYTDLFQVPACLPRSLSLSHFFSLYPRRISCFQRLRDSEGEGRLIAWWCVAVAVMRLSPPLSSPLLSFAVVLVSLLAPASPFSEKRRRDPRRRLERRNIMSGERKRMSIANLVDAE